MEPIMDRAIRLACGKTQEDLATESGLGVNTIWRYEHGHSVRESTYNLVQAALYRFARDYMASSCVGPSIFYGRVRLVHDEIVRAENWVRPKNY